ncbi:hypothetical protein I3843_10G147100 [Carya illinoinensis]|nr:hypothetical protein I3843_10G147100 [Carya illinoinensis]
MSIYYQIKERAGYYCRQFLVINTIKPIYYRIKVLVTYDIRVRRRKLGEDRPSVTRNGLKKITTLDVGIKFCYVK